MSTAEFEPVMPASERPKTQAFDRATADIGVYYSITRQNFCPEKHKGSFRIPLHDITTIYQLILRCRQWPLNPRLDSVMTQRPAHLH
jgi:hypothetical protein